MEITMDKKRRSLTEWEAMQMLWHCLVHGECLGDGCSWTHGVFIDITDNQEVCPAHCPDAEWATNYKNICVPIDFQLPFAMIAETTDREKPWCSDCMLDADCESYEDNLHGE
jgi:hypothetical protein